MAEGTFPKSDGDILYASEVNSLFEGAIVNNIKQLINQDKLSNYDQFMFKSDLFADGFTDTNLISSSTNWATVGKQYWTTTNAAELISEGFTFSDTINYATPYIDFNIYETVDECNDSSVSTDIWDATFDDDGSVTEDTNSMLIKAYDADADTGLSCYAQVVSDNILIDSTHTYLATKYNWTHSGNGTTQDRYIEIKLGSVTLFQSHYNNTAPAYEWSNTLFYNYSIGTYPLGTPTGDHLVELYYNPDCEIIFVYYDGRYFDRVDVSGAGDLKLTLRTNCSGNQSGTHINATSSFDIDWVRRQKPNPNSSLAVGVSANDGTNYDTITNGNSGDITTTGTQLKLKTTATIADSEHIHIRGWGCYVK